MRSRFPGFFPVRDDELKAFWNDAVFSFDASILLNCYRVKPDTADRLLTILERLEDKVWLSHQAAFEFLKNRESVIISGQVAYESAPKEMKGIIDQIRDQLRSLSRHPLIDLQEISDAFERQMTAAIEKFPELKGKHPNLLGDDVYLTRLDRIFNERTGGPFSAEEMTKISKGGVDRYKAKIPPGYKDNQKDEKDRYGDLILWKQMIAHCREVSRPLIFVTDDVKEDWWEEIRGQKRGPRHELVVELYEQAQQPMLMYTMDRFLQQAASVLEVEVDKETVEDAREARRQVSGWTMTPASLAERAKRQTRKQGPEVLFIPNIKKYFMRPGHRDVDHSNLTDWAHTSDIAFSNRDGTYFVIQVKPSNNDSEEEELSSEDSVDEQGEKEQEWSSEDQSENNDDGQ